MASHSEELNAAIAQIGTQLRAGIISEDEAINRLVALGFIDDDAREQVYFALGGDDVVAPKGATPRIGRDVAMIWWRYLDTVARGLELHHAAADTDRKLHKLPTNPRHTADILKGGAMLCSAAVDTYCRGFAATRCWPNHFENDELYFLQHRLCAAKAALDYMTTPGFASSWNARVLQTAAPDPGHKEAFLAFLLVAVWDVIGEGYLDAVVKELQALLPPGELERLEAENPPLRG